MRSTEQIRTELLAFVVSLVGESGGGPVEAGDELLTSGLLDSLGAMRLVEFVESHFDIPVPPADMTIEHFATVETIVTYLEPRLRDDAPSSGA